MIRTLSVATVFALATGLAFSAMAQDAAPKIAPGKTPTSTMSDQVPQMKTTAAATAAQPTAPFALTEEEGKAWLDKPVYSSDGKKLGEVVAFQRDADNKIIGLHIDIGGYLGMGQTRVSLTNAQFKLQTGRVVLNVTSVEAKDLPRVPA